MRILLTGAAGFVGSHLAERLLREGHQVLGVDNFCTGQRQNLEYLTPFAGFSFLEADAARPMWRGRLFGLVWGPVRDGYPPGRRGPAMV